MDIVWDGVTKESTISDQEAALRHRLADAGKRFDWNEVLSIITENPELVNSTRLGGTSLYAPLHQAAYGGAPLPVVEQLIRFGAFRTLRAAHGGRPVDIANRQGHHHLTEILVPELLHNVPLEALKEVEINFHEVIQERVGKLVFKHRLRLPLLEPLLELEDPQMWFSVPGMYGGFSYRLEREGGDPMVVAESWCRISGGSGQRHEIDQIGNILVDEGFV